MSAENTNEQKKKYEPKWPQTSGQEINPTREVACMRSMQEWARQRGLKVK